MPSVLVVDDDPDIRELFGGGLEHEGFDVVLAEDGAQGIEALSRARFDVMVLDVFMPGFGRLDTVKLFHAHAPSVPLIAISGHVFVDHPFPDQFRKLALELGPARCLGKPLPVSVLVREIRAVLNGSAYSCGGAAPPSANVRLIKPSKPGSDELLRAARGDRLRACAGVVGRRGRDLQVGIAALKRVKADLTVADGRELAAQKLRRGAVLRDWTERIDDPDPRARLER
jgi:DNA-binding response OmpR family regulator